MSFLTRVASSLFRRGPKVVSLKDSDWELNTICDAAEEEVVPPQTLDMAEDEEAFVGTLEREDPEESLMRHARTSLQIALATIDLDQMDEARKNLYFLATTHGVQSGPLDRAGEAHDILNDLPDVLLPNAGDLIDELLRKASRPPPRVVKVAFATPTAEERAAGDHVSCKRRACFQVNEDTETEASGLKMAILHFRL